MTAILQRAARAALVLASATFMLACPRLKAPWKPPVEAFSKPDSRGASTLVMIVNGAGDQPDHLTRNGMIDALWESGCDCDARVAYYTGPAYALGNLVDALVEQVPAHYSRVIWVGISAGAVAVLEVARLRPEAVDGLVLLSPFLGPERAVSEVARAGGLQKWEAIPPIERIEKTWVYLRGHAKGEESTPLTLAYGGKDQFVDQQSLLAESLRPSQVLCDDDGKHDWATFARLWSEYLAGHPSWL